MASQSDSEFVIDTTKPSVARMYDYYLDGKDHYAVDREAVGRINEVLPGRAITRENRAFLRRAVRYMALRGIRQFVDIGSGLPTVSNTHEVVREITPDAHVVYVDNDPVVLAHGRALLAVDRYTTVVRADMHDPAEVLGHPDLTARIDFSEPIGILMIAMVHFLAAEERPHIMGQLRSVLVAGSCFTATHLTVDGKPPEAAAHVESVYRKTSAPIYFRTRDEVARFFDGFDLVEPGLVTVDRWRPDPHDPAPEATGWLYGGVGVKNS